MKTILLSSAALVALTLSSAHAQSVVETFDYPAGTLGNTAVTGTGQTGTWVKSPTDSTAANIGVSTGINWTITPDYAYTPSGTAISSTTGTPWSDTGAFQLATGIDFDSDGEIFFSFLARTTTLGSTGLITLETTSGSELARLYQTVGGPAVTASIGGTGVGNIFGTGSQDILVVGRIQTLGIGNDTIAVDIIRSAETIGSSFTPDATASAAVTGTGSYLRFWNFANGGLIGDFRMGDTYASVVPEPSTYALFAGALVMSWVMVRRRA